MVKLYCNILLKLSLVGELPTLHQQPTVTMANVDQKHFATVNRGVRAAVALCMYFNDYLSHYSIGNAQTKN